jgi:ribosomal protein S18 acetylase RimI-like enzyme
MPTVVKRVVRRPIRGYRSPYRSRFRFVSLEKAGKRRFIAAFGKVMQGGPSGDFNPNAPAREFAILSKLAGAGLDPSMWRIAYLKGKLAGMILAQKRRQPWKGTLFFFGVAPEFRGRGLGKVLHAKGLELLAESGCRSYVGGTDARNAAMLATFRANGCKSIGTWLCDAATGKKLRKL